ncbi:hypothetical protein EG834_22195, partial [bacterium]|nr:hypothetical protein [bacterium]
MAIAAVTLLSLMSSNLLTFLLAWSLIDLIEFIVLAQWIDDTELMRKTVVSFGFRLAGTLLVIAALAISKQSSQPFQIASAQGLLYVLLLVGVGLRLGIQPVHLPFTHSELVRRTLGTVMRLASPISAFALLIQLSSPQNMNGILLLVAAFATLAAVYGAGRWATSQSDTAGRQFWTLSLSGIAILAAMNGQSSVVLACAGIMVLAGGFIFVQQGRERRQRLLFIILMLGLTGLPFTPFSGLWGFDGGTTWSFTRLVQLISMALLILGAARLYAKKELASHTGENWISFFASAGLIVLTLT